MRGIVEKVGEGESRDLKPRSAIRIGTACLYFLPAVKAVSHLDLVKSKALAKAGAGATNQ